MAPPQHRGRHPSAARDSTRKAVWPSRSQEMDPAGRQRANATDSHELDQAGHRREGTHDDPGAQKPFRSARPEPVAGCPEGKVRHKRAHEETDRENHEHGVDRMAKNGGGASHPPVIGRHHLVLLSRKRLHVASRWHASTDSETTEIPSRFGAKLESKNRKDRAHRGPLGLTPRTGARGMERSLTHGA